jgi:hypothetical protein
MAETQPRLQPAALSLSAMISQVFMESAQMRLSERVDDRQSKDLTGAVVDNHAFPS